MNPILWFKLRHRGVFRPWKTHRVAKKYNLRLSLVCAVLLTSDPWRQVGWLDAGDQIAKTIAIHRLYEGMEILCGERWKEALGIMHYLQTTLGID